MATTKQTQTTLKLHVIPFSGVKAVAVGGKPETHTLQSFARDVIGTGSTYTMIHQHTRWPKDIPSRPDQARGVKTPRIKENFISRQELTGDDDRKLPGVVDFWLNDPFFGKYGAMFAESSSSQPGAEKGHPVIIFDKPITDLALYEEALRAFIHRYHGKTDKAIKSAERLVYNKPGARVHMLGNTCPWATFKAEILTPYRQFEEQERRAAALKKAQRPQRPNGGHGGKIEQLVIDLGNMGKGDDRHGALVSLSVKMGGELPAAVINACHRNGYFDEYGKNDNELRRVWGWGSKVHQDKPAAVETAIQQTAVITQTAEQVQERPTHSKLYAAYHDTKEGDPVTYDLTGSVSDHLADEFFAAADAVEKAQTNLRLATKGKKRHKLPLIDFGPEPQHTCSLMDASLSVITFREQGGVSLNAINSHDWRTCEGCMFRRVKRAVMQITTEQYEHKQTFYLSVFATVDSWQRKRDAWRQRAQRAGLFGERVRFYALPQASGKVFVIHTSKEDATNNEPLSDNPQDTLATIEQLMRTPAENRMRGSKGFGGNYQGSRGDGREVDKEGRVVQYIGYKNIEDAAAILGVKLSEQQTGDSDIDIVEAYRLLEAAKVEMRLRKSFIGLNGWFEQLLDEDVTLNVHSKKGQIPMYPKCDMGGEIPYPEARIAALVEDVPGF